MFLDITYSFYPVYCRLYGVNPRAGAASTPRCAVEIADYRRPCSAILLSNPNAPTGIALPRSAIEQLLTAHPDQLVVIDEAYVDFGAESAVPLVARYDNLLVIQTFSKSRSLAGLRVGFADRPASLIDALERVKDSFNSYPLDCFAIAGASAAIEDDGWFQETRARIMASRDWLTTIAHRARLRGAALAGEFGVRPPSRPCRRTARRGPAPAGRAGPAFPEAADLGLPAHHGRDGRRVPPPDRGREDAGLRDKGSAAPYSAALLRSSAGASSALGSPGAVAQASSTSVTMRRPVPSSWQTMRPCSSI